MLNFVNYPEREREEAIKRGMPVEPEKPAERQLRTANYACKNCGVSFMVRGPAEEFAFGPQVTIPLIKFLWDHKDHYILLFFNPKPPFEDNTILALNVVENRVEPVVQDP